jgi:putative N6-adenine-specific DNA methylase
MSADRLSCFAVAAPGLAPLVAAELRALGVAGAADEAGVSWEGGAVSLYSANLWLRTATRVLVRVARFRARSFIELERHARKIEWGRWVGPGEKVRFRVTCRKSRLYHSDAVAQRLGDAAIGAGAAGAATVAGDADADGSGPLFVARFDHDELTLSIDSSGEPLYKRGYRQAVAKAPVRETLAAAMLMACEWRDDAPIIDPFCGSGAVVIEAALLARNMAPGLRREFGFERWPGHDVDLWGRLRADASGKARRKGRSPILGTDRDEGAIEAARANAERAGVLSDVELACRPLSALEPPPGTGLLVTNPPYGVRVGEQGRIADLYAALGNVARGRLPGWKVALLSADPRLESRTGLRLEERIRTKNGGIPVRLVVGTV